MVQSDVSVLNISLMGDGKIVVEGFGRLERMSTEGSSDPTFRLDGIADVYDLFGGTAACPAGLIVGSDDSITLPWTNLGHELRLVRFLP